MPNRRMKLPNGFGQISKIKNRRLRNPYRAMVTVGKTPEGRPVCKLLKPQAYFHTYTEAYTALVLYNRNPYDLETMSLSEVYNLWIEDHRQTVSESRIRSIKSAWKYCSPIVDKPIRFLRVGDIKNCIEQDDIPPNMRTVLKSALNNVCDYAVECGMADSNPARECHISKAKIIQIENEKKNHIAFTEEELEILWQHANETIVKIILIECYSGWRPNEFLQMKKSSVDLEAGVFVGGSKTESGKNRHVPIHSKISALLQELMNESGSEHVVSSANGMNFPYRTYISQFSQCMQRLNLSEDHRPHDARKTFVTLCKKYKVDEYAIKHLVGHYIDDITERIYTDRPPEWLREEIEKIK